MKRNHTITRLCGVALTLALVPLLVSAGTSVPPGEVELTDAQSVQTTYSTIQEAVDAATPSSVIVVGAGLFDEYVVIEDQSFLQIRSDDSSTVRGFRIKQSDNITIDGFDIDSTSTTENGIVMMGGISQNDHITISNNEIHNANSANSGIKVAGGNSDITITGNDIHDNGRNGIIFIDSSGGPHFVTSNQIHENGRNGISVARGHVITIGGNIITGNGTNTGIIGGRYGIWRGAVSGGPGQPGGITLIDNIITGNNGNVVAGQSSQDLGNFHQTLDATDSGNATTAGNEGPGVGPVAPLNLAAIAGNLQVSLSWDASNGAISYQVKRSLTSGGPYSTIAASVSQTSFIDTPLTAGLTFFYVVSGVSTSGEGPISSEVSATPFGTAPPAPTGVVATEGNQAICLVWDATTGANNYNVKRALVTGGPYTTIASSITATDYMDSGLTNGTAYFYVVSAVNGGGERPDSAEVTGTPFGGSPPVAPTNLVATHGASFVNLTWIDSRGADSYTVKSSATSGGPYTIHTAGIAPGGFFSLSANNGVTVFYVVTATNGDGESGNSNEVSATPGAPVAPTGLAVIDVSSDNLTLGWTVTPGANDYSIKRSTTTGGPYTTLQTGVTGTQYTDFNAGPTGGTLETQGRRYFYVITAVNGAGESGLSNEVSEDPPVASTNLVISNVGPNDITITWDSSPGIVLYHIGRSTVAGGPYNTIRHESSTTSTDNNAVPGTTYFYVVVAGSGAGLSLPTNEVSAKAGPPDPPENMRTRVGPGQVLVEWDAVEGADQYDLNEINFGDGVTVNPPDTSHLFTFLNNGDTFQYVVTAVSNNRGTSNQAGPVFATPSADVPGAPFSLGAAAGTNQVSLNWQIPIFIDGNLAIVDEYLVKRAVMPLGPYSIIATGVTSTSYIDTGLVGGTTFYYVVTAVNSVGESGSSNEALATPTGGTPAPANLGASAGDGSVYLIWSAVEEADSYSVKRSTQSGGPYSTVQAGLIATSFTDLSVTNGTQYFYVVSSTGASGEGLNSGEVPALPVAAPAAPANLVAVGLDAAINLTWDVSAGATSYDVFRSLTSGGPYTVLQTGITGTSHPDGGLANGTAYFYVVAALNSAGSLGLSNEASAVPNGAPEIPTGLAATPGNQVVDLVWVAAARATSYDVQRSTTAGTGHTTVANVSSTAYSDTTAANGTTYFYVVRGVNGAGQSDPSNEASGLPAAVAPDPPSNVRTTAYSNTIDVEWDASPSDHVAGYNVYRKRTLPTAEPNFLLLNSSGVVLNTKYRDSTASNGDTYLYHVTAVGE